MRIKPRCNECVGFKNAKLLSPKATCFEMGRSKASEVCTMFTFNSFDIVSREPSTSIVPPMLELSQVISCFPTSKLRSLALLISYEKLTRNCGFSFYQKIYLRYRGHAGANYLSNFMIAYVIRAVPSRRDIPSMLYLTDRRCISQFSFENYEDSMSISLYTADDFEALKSRMLGKVDPEIDEVEDKITREVQRAALDKRKTKKKADADQGFVVSIDEAFDAGIICDAKVKKERAFVNLTEIMLQMQKGFLYSSESDEDFVEQGDKTDDDYDSVKSFSVDSRLL